jgi:HD-like signal output (HDOD) protein
MEYLLAIAYSLNAAGPVLGMLNHAISKPRTPIPEIATILRCDVMPSARIIRISNLRFYVSNSKVFNTIDYVLKRVGMREIARLNNSVTMQGMALPTLRAYEITSAQFDNSAHFIASASQFITAAVKMDPNKAYLSGPMRRPGILVLNKFTVIRNLP